MGSLDDSAWAQPAAYAVECAITALWAGVGIRPDVVVGHGFGKIAAAQAAGVVLTLEDGLRLAATQDDFEEVLSAVGMSAPSVTLVDGANGQPVKLDGGVDRSYWRLQAGGHEDLRGCAEPLADLGVDVAVEIGPQAAQGRVVTTARTGWSNGVEVGCDRPDSQSMGGFAEMVAKAYEEGLAVSFEGLFAGETRRRVSLPTYPFQRRRHWV